MMRPMAHEKQLPSALFRWRSPDGSEVLVWRIPRAYTASQEDLTDHIKASLDVADPKIGHVMCFYGVGDHGGGPTKLQIEWLMSHKDAFPGAKLIFSHPRAFFDAVKPFADKLPVVEEELQYHAIGCYSVVHEMKRQMRAAEHGLISAENITGLFPEDAPKDSSARIEEAWKKTLFNQFHDIYAGTSLPSAYDDSRDQLGSARDTADSIINDTLFRRMRRLPPNPVQQIVAFNPSDHDFDGYLQHEPWSGSNGWIADEKGERIPHQKIFHESVTCGDRRLLWHDKIPALSEKIYQLRTDDAPQLPDSDLQTTNKTISNKYWYIVGTDDGARLIYIAYQEDRFPLLGWDGLEITVQYDNSDTWSHGIDRYSERVSGKFRQRATVVEETGPVRASMRIDTKYRDSWITIWTRLYANDPRLEISLWANWNQKLQISKLMLPFVFPIRDRLDGIPGGHVNRPQNGQEFPIVDWTLLNMDDGAKIGIVCPDCYGVDGTLNVLRFTLLRSPVYAWHDPTKLDKNSFYRYTDRGEHRFRFTLMLDLDPEELKRMALSEHRPPICYDWTKGMK